MIAPAIDDEDMNGAQKEAGAGIVSHAAKIR
jgi:hypothetical protein